MVSESCWTFSIWYFHPQHIVVTGASHNDGKIFEQIRPFFYNNEIYGDKAYKLPNEEDVCTISRCIYTN